MPSEMSENSFFSAAAPSPYPLPHIRGGEEENKGDNARSEILISSQARKRGSILIEVTKL